MRNYMNFKAEIKYLDNKLYKSIHEIYEDHNKAILNSEKIFGLNFDFKRLNFNFKKLRFFLDTNINFIQHNFFWNLIVKHNELLNITLEQKNVIEKFYLKNFSECHMFNRDKDNFDFNQIMLTSLLMDSDVIFNKLLPYFYSSENIEFLFEFISLKTELHKLNSEIENIFLNTKKGNILFDLIEDKKILNKYQFFNKMFSKYQEFIDVKNNLQNF